MTCLSSTVSLWLAVFLEAALLAAKRAGAALDLLASELLLFTCSPPIRPACIWSAVSALP